MPTGLRPRVNEAREFLEIAKDFKDPRELIREALSNSWDANAKEASLFFDLLPVPGSRAKKIRVTIQDDGEGMSSQPRPEVGSSEIEGFFNLGDSAKKAGSIGSKGHGTKIYYRSHGVRVDTWKDGKHISARIESDPWASLKRGEVPTFGYDEKDDQQGRGTKIVIEGFEARQSDFSQLDELLKYIQWYTVAGSIGHYFGQTRNMKINLRQAGGGSVVSVGFGFSFPDESVDLSNGTAATCKLFGPEAIDCGLTSDGQSVAVDIVGALLGEANRTIVPRTYEQMGLWLAKDYIRIERNNQLLEKVFGGQYFYRNYLIVANCQQFDLTANRNNIRTSGEEYEMAISAIEDWCKKINSSEFALRYFDTKKTEEDAEKKQRAALQLKEKEKKALERRAERLSQYKARPDAIAKSIQNSILKEPRNEAETALLLQSMISANHPGIDFRIGEYNTSLGVDLTVERKDKGYSSLWFVELVFSLDKISQWSHHPDGFHAIVCYELGNVAEEFRLSDDRISKLIKKDAPGRYALMLGSDTLEVYVLREMLK